MTVHIVTQDTLSHHRRPVIDDIVCRGTVRLLARRGDLGDTSGGNGALFRTTIPMPACLRATVSSGRCHGDSTLTGMQDVRAAGILPKPQYRGARAQ